MEKKSGIKIKKIIKTVLITVMLFLLVVFNGARLYFRLPVRDYYKISEKEFKIPGLSQNLVPQGIDYLDNGLFLIGGYQKNGAPSRACAKPTFSFARLAFTIRPLRSNPW